jgi:hypothetical protein
MGAKGEPNVAPCFACNSPCFAAPAPAHCGAQAPASLARRKGILDEKGNIPRSNIAFLADAFGTLLGGLLGTSALTTYVESASAVREGGRTGEPPPPALAIPTAPCLLRTRALSRTRFDARKCGHGRPRLLLTRFGARLLARWSQA